MRLLVVLLAVLPLPLAFADHCTTWSTSEPDLTVPIAGTTFYVDNDPCPLECGISVWVYEEWNGIPGLQRYDEMRDDTCHGMIDADGFWS